MNEFLIGALGESIVFMRPVPSHLSKEQAVTLAAWLVAIADPDRRRFDEALAEVQNT